MNKSGSFTYTQKSRWEKDAANLIESLILGVFCIVSRYIYTLILITVSPCLASGSSYSYNKLPIPQIDYLKTPYEQIRDVNSTALFDGSISYDPEGSRIVEWMWNFYKYNGKDWDFILSARGPDKAILNFKSSEIGWFRARLWVRTSDGRWNQDSDVKDCFLYVIYDKIFADEYVAFGTGMTFSYLIELPKDIQVKEACFTMLDEYGIAIVEIWIKNPVIGKETKVEWDGRMNKGPLAGEFLPAGSFSLNFRVIPFHSIPENTNKNKTQDTTETHKEQIDPNNNQD